jgi:uncharacterized protein YbjT (DUF2867 family)
MDGERADLGAPARVMRDPLPDRNLVLLAGATGYIGGRLLRVLEHAGYPIRCLARRPEVLQARVAPGTEVIKADCLDRASLPPALEGVHTA